MRFITCLDGTPPTKNPARLTQNQGLEDYKMIKFARNYLATYARDTKGATMIEYGLIAALVAVALVAALGALTTNLDTLFTTTIGGSL
jgi:pilus assembly protein Flp/PilA